MAQEKKKCKKQPLISPERYMREKARQLPIDKCYISEGWQQSGEAIAIVTRLRPGGKLVIGCFIIDTFCLGVTNCFFRVSMDREEVEDIVETFSEEVGEMNEKSYKEVHNFIYGAVEFAEEGGIRPHPDFRTTRYVLDEDTDDIPLIEYAFGRNGKHLLVMDDFGSRQKYLRTLQENLGDDSFDYCLEDTESNADEAPVGIMEKIERMNAEMNRHPAEEYSYNHPEYPTEPVLRHPFIADILGAKENTEGLSDSLMQRLTSLPPDEAAADISQVMLCEIGRTYRAIDDKTIGEPENSILYNAIEALAEIGSPAALDAILEVMRQNNDFLQYHFGFGATEVIPDALCACRVNGLAPLLDFLYTPGYDHFMRAQIPKVLVTIADEEPGRRGEIIEIFRRLLVSLPERLPRREACDGTFAGLLMSFICDLHAPELIPDLKPVFDTDCVDLTVAGNYDSVAKELMSPVD